MTRYYSLWFSFSGTMREKFSDGSRDRKKYLDLQHST